MSRVAQELSLRNEPVVVVAPRAAGSTGFDAAQRFRVFRYPGVGRVSSFAAMTLWLFGARVTTRGSYMVASMWFPGGLAACFLPRPLRGRLGVLAHGSEIAPERGGLRRYIMRHVFKHADVIIANSRFTRDLLVRAGVRDNVEIVYNGIDDDPIVPQRAAHPIILSVGRLVSRKGFDKIIEALPAVLKLFPTAVYEIVGAGPQRAELEALADRCGVRDQVTFLGAVDDAQLREAYARAWIFALPVRAVGSDVEGFGLVYLEAALAALPAIGGRGSGAEDTIVAGDTGLLVEGTSIEAVAQAILGLLGDPDRAAIMGARGRQRALEHFTWRKTAAEIERLMTASN
jgi:phosphatidylinositol alpha-1,6-mannosyltransferase